MPMGMSQQGMVAQQRPPLIDMQMAGASGMMNPQTMNVNNTPLTNQM